MSYPTHTNTADLKMSSTFSTAELTSLERQVEIENKSTKLSDIWTANDLNRCIKFQREGEFQNICLQFSDEIVTYAVEIERQLKKHIEANIYLLADTSYGSCCVDEIAASHAAADSMIHFGHACLSKVTRLPVLYVFPKNDVNIDQFVECFEAAVPDKMEKVFIFYTVGCFHAIDSIANKLHHSKYIKVEIGKLAEDEEPDVLCWSIKNNQNTESCVCIFIGQDNQSFFNISMSIKCKKWLLFDIDNSTMKEVQSMDTKFLRKRSFYIEKCKDAQTLGIVVGTLTTKGYLDIIKHIQELAGKRNVKTYIISVGKVNPAKLANYSEIDCFVLVGCSENNLYNNSKDFYKPLISVFEAEMALNPAWHHLVPDTYSTDFREVLPEGKLHKSSNEVQSLEGDISLVTGKVRDFNCYNEGASGDDYEGALQERGKTHLAELNSFTKFNDRTFRGLDPALGKNEPSKLEKGRKGIAISYDEI